MSSENRTALGLNDWRLYEKPEMEDFNRDNKILTGYLLACKSSGLLINSNFSVWQRAESAVAPATANYVCVDRWRVKAVSGTPTIARLSATSGLKCTGGSAQITYAMDAYDLAIVSGKTCTLSYKLNGVIKTQQLTPSGATVVSLNLANGDQLEWVKLELGEQATEYLPPKYGENLNECVRYYNKIYFTFMGTANRYDVYCLYFPEMRVVPTANVSTKNDGKTMGKISLWNGGSMEVAPYKINPKNSSCAINMSPLQAVSADCGYEGHLYLDAEV